LLPTLVGGDLFVVWSIENGDSRRVSYSAIKAYMRAGFVTTITELPAATVPLAGTEEMPVVQDGVAKRTAINNILNANIIPYISNGLGSVSEPSYTFAGDLNTGMWSPAADTIAFSEGGTEVMRITSAGNVGIGTNNPASKLDVNGVLTTGNITARGDGSEGGQISFNNAANSAGPLTLDVDASGNGRLITTVNNANLSLGQLSGTGGIIQFYTANSERMRIDATGNVGIGTSSPDASALLDVSSTTKGFLPPRMTTTQRDLISTPPNGLMLYNSTTNKLQVRAAGAWVDLH